MTDSKLVETPTEVEIIEESKSKYGSVIDLIFIL